MTFHNLSWDTLEGGEKEAAIENHEAGTVCFS